MRLRRLDMVRYGKFTGHSIDFGPKPVGGPDFHILVGPNEAGKSTIANGYLDLLYGIEERSPYSFLHDYASMRVDGVFDLDGCERMFARIKQRSNTLLDETGQPVPEVAIAAHLAGLSRTDYASMFSLDDETIEAGGRAILDSRGDLGQLLFAAGAGLAHASEVLGALDAEADGLYRKHAQSTEVASLKKQLAELKSARDAIDTVASTYEALEAERAGADRRYEELLAERAALASRLDAIDRDVRAMPMLAELDRRLAALAALPEVVSPVTTWSGSVADLIRDDAAAGARMAAKADELERLARRMEAVEIDVAILAVSERILGLAELKARYASAGLDLPGRRMELQILENTVASSLVALGRTSDPEPHALLLPAATAGAIRALAERRSGIATALSAARDEVSTAVDALNAARDRVSEERAVPAAARARLLAAVVAARESGNAREVRDARQAVDEARGRWEAARLQLRPWDGRARELAEMSVPSVGQVLVWRDAADEARTRVAVLQERVSELRGATSSLRDRIDAIRAASDLMDDKTAGALRHAREQAWTKHRLDLGADTADAFAAVLARDDAAGAERLAHVRELEELRTAMHGMAKVEVALAASEAELESTEAGRLSLCREIRHAFGPLADGIDAIATPERMVDAVEGLLHARSVALEAWLILETADHSLTRAMEEGVRLTEDLVAAAGRVGLPLEQEKSMDGLVAVSASFLDRQSALDARVAEARRTVSLKEEDLASRRRALDAAERREQEWLEGIAEALSGTWLASGIPAVALGSVLDQLSTLAQALHDRDAMRLRIDKMAADKQAFHEEVAGVAALVGEAVAVGEPDQAAVRLAARLEQALRAEAARKALIEEMADVEKARDALAGDLAAHERTKREVLRAFGVSTLEDVVRSEETLRERGRLKQAITEIEERLLDENRVTDTAAIRTRLADLEEHSLAVEKAEIGQRLQDLDESLKQQVIRQTRAVDALDAIGGDSSVARIDARRRTVLLDMEDKVVRYLRLKLGSMSAGNALRDYRERHRSGMMRRASAAFGMMTRGAYTGLSSQPSKTGELLIALQHDGRSKVADSLSKGTRFQLYLALRLAGYHEFAALRPTVPFIADDIMETFDEMRSEEVFKLFGEMAGVGQVIYLTHHRHLCEIAKVVVPGVIVHELG